MTSIEAKEESDKDIVLSKFLSWLLRHAAIKEGLPMSPEGYIEVDRIIQHRSVLGKYNKSDIERVVRSNDKQRFQLRVNPNTNALEIKANQGHTIKKISDEELKVVPKRVSGHHHPCIETSEVSNALRASWVGISDGGCNGLIEGKEKYKTVVHGTLYKFWPQIKQLGLSRMQRNHIHFARGTLDDEAVISGVRKNTQIYIYVNIGQAIDDGLVFYESDNGVVLTPGNYEGHLELKYFQKVIDARSGNQRIQHEKTAQHIENMTKLTTGGQASTASPTCDVAPLTTAVATPTLPYGASAVCNSLDVPKNQRPSQQLKKNKQRISQPNYKKRDSYTTSNLVIDSPVCRDKGNATTASANGEPNSNSAVENMDPNNEITTPKQYKHKLFITGYAPYVRADDLVHACSRFGPAHCERRTVRAAIVGFASAEHAEAAVRAAARGLLFVYGTPLKAHFFIPGKDQVAPPKQKERARMLSPPEVWAGPEGRSPRPACSPSSLGR
ncbi:tRNA 2'-phosphotransferase 1 [Eumeta japonica]|uniref:2'-phosphotransferase n=1 Tax=Eumeta variegata TaxID=151549 RepID=A0A4C1XKX8_EUMVA|nr:tRNA 2'-phosphotransferase 1 [Eumeta japonica]